MTIKLPSTLGSRPSKSKLNYSPRINKYKAEKLTMSHISRPTANFFKKLATLSSVVAFTTSFAFITPIFPVSAVGIASLADVGLREFLVKDGRQILRLALPVGPEMKLGASVIGDNIKNAQECIELVRLRLEQVGFSNDAVWGGAIKDAKTANDIIKKNKDILVGSDQDSAKLYDELLETMDRLLLSLRDKDIVATNKLQEESGALLGKLREAQYPAGLLPYTIPDEYKTLPRLAGRADIELVVKSSGSNFRLEDGKTVVPQITLLLTVDGYHAPLTAGNFVDLVNKKFYDGMKMQRVEELIVQTGQPTKSTGYVDPKTNVIREIPLELFYKQDTEPVYGITSDDDTRSTEAFVLPFQAYGALGMARDNDNADSGSSQFFMLKWLQALVAPGRNTLDGFYTEFGYITSNENLLSQITIDDTVVSAKVVRGLSNLIVP